MAYPGNAHASLLRSDGQGCIVGAGGGKHFDVFALWAWPGCSDCALHIFRLSTSFSQKACPTIIFLESSFWETVSGEPFLGNRF